MATTAPFMASLTVPGAAATTDDMDLQSDSGYGYGDGDIDIDLESTGDNEHGDDNDLDLEDAGMDNGDGFQVEDQDLFMGDDQGSTELGGDVDIEDAKPSLDIDASGALDVSGSTNSSRIEDQPATVSAGLRPTTSWEDKDADDIIDYSSDEDEQPAPEVYETGQVDQSTAAANPAEEEATSEKAELAEHENKNEASYEQENVIDISNADDVGEHYDNDEGGHDESAGPTWDDTAQSEWQEQAAEDETYAEFQYQDDHQDEDDNALDEPEHDETKYFDVEEEQDKSPQHDDYNETNLQQDKDSHDGGEKAEGHEEQRLHSVMLNYDGTEMFLFEPHPEQQPQMFLLSDETVAGKTFHDLFQACRDQLGDSVKHETELGLCVKDLKNLEIFEDSIACASFSLKNILDIYLSLHAQDGNTNPAPLQVKVLFRTRVISVFGDLQKAVQDQVGFAAVQATHVTSQLASNTTESYEQGEEDHDDWDHGDGGEYYDEEREDEDEGNEASHVSEHENSRDEVQENKIEPAAEIAAREEREEEDDSQDALDAKNAAVSSENSSAAAAEAAEDFIDYTDDEDEAKDNQTEQPSLKQPSSGSSTVQGDNAPLADVAADLTNPTNTFADAAQLDFGFDQGYENDQDQDEVDYDQVEQQTVGDNFDENGTLNLDGHLVSGPVETAGNDDLLDNLDYTAGTGNDDTFDDLVGDLPPTDGPGDFDGTNDFVDLDTGEGLATEPAVADEDAGPNASASQSGQPDLDSPQSLKRSIDEVDGGAKSSDQSDDKRVRV